jgi:hypothetical protein
MRRKKRIIAGKIHQKGVFSGTLGTELLSTPEDCDMATTSKIL